MISTVESLGTSTLSTAPHPSVSSGLGLLKILMDRGLAALGLLLLAPLLLAIAIAVKLDSPGPVFFTQRRVGLNGRTFSIYKFRSMQIDAEARLQELLHRNEMQGPLFKIKDDPRVTRIGRILRKLSLDELPQLINVMKGEMSLVGPRPPLPSEVSHFEPWQLHKFCVRPGVTGLWQVSGRSELLSFDQAIMLDLDYVARWSLALDLKILFKTVPVVLSARGAH